jgi:hypothetical protein
MPRTASDLPAAERAFLLHLQVLGLRYFLDNQTPGGLILDRQHNFGPKRLHGWCSTAATGMGFLALALASAEPFRLLTPADAATRIRRGLSTALHSLPRWEGVVPHFIDSATHKALGIDVCSTVDTAWLVAGALAAAAFLGKSDLKELAKRLFDCIDWRAWTVAASQQGGLLRHGRDREGNFLPCAWDRLNGETAFMYVLAAGARPDRAWPGENWPRLQPFWGTTAGLRFISADLGLFVFQYGFDLLDLETWREPGGLDLMAEAVRAAEANYRHCRAAAGRFRTYRRYWGLSAGDGPGDPPAADTYRCYAPGQPLDGTAHLTATLASVASLPAPVLENVLLAREDPCTPLGRYGFSNLNLDRGWVGRDMVGIDAGAAVLALDNFLAGGRVRRCFHELPCVRNGLRRIGFVPTGDLVRQPQAHPRRQRA